MNRRRVGLYVLLCLAAWTCQAEAAGDLPRPWIRLLTENRDWLCGWGLQEGVPFEVYVWVLPDTAGIFCVEYRVVIETDFGPFNLVLDHTTANPLASSVTGIPTEPPGTTICLPFCQRDYFWAHKLVFMPSSSNAFAFVNIAAHDDSGDVRAVSCTEPGNPHISLHYFIDDWGAGIGWVCPAIEKTSWGAIKEMYRQQLRRMPDQ